MEERASAIERFSKCIETAETFVADMLAQFNWSRDSLKETSKIASKPKKEPKFEFQQSCLKANDPYSVRIDQTTQEAIINNTALDDKTSHEIDSLHNARYIPSSFEDLVTNFTAEDRLAIYQYVIDKTPKTNHVAEIEMRFKKKDKDEKPTSLAEIAAYRRETRRRNPKYRVAKNPLSYKEEIAQLIQLQTETMAEYLNQSKSSKKGRKYELKETNDKHRKRTKRSKSRDRQSSRDHRKRSRRD
ncbi:uncharacterized protein LOC129754155 [Uranotaenia lowii]|uniref:uncharacterized protein LOC129754155 n=1 Tax=Uranotaenia lowii TaxID=190385 RepID=UPI0024794130|nr:uncharacterized protein LOC129754155 [Uranotaenia lowii]XP_055606018.1 uncharacterized protein LOC129754155 [Uranotaenia lowii]XP_055606019.1 uncharacterized protein LOC129754155 [Uranotaenia lowii]